VKRTYVPARDNAVVNRLNKTKAERVVDHEQERLDRLKAAGAIKRAAAIAQVPSPPSPPEYHSVLTWGAAQRKAEQELAAQRAAEKAARSYDILDAPGSDEEWGAPKKAHKSVREMEEDFM
jgi:hypothetical protein